VIISIGSPKAQSWETVFRNTAQTQLIYKQMAAKYTALLQKSSPKTNISAW
jgi:hypothetical protein